MPALTKVIDCFSFECIEISQQGITKLEQVMHALFVSGANIIIGFTHTLASTSSACHASEIPNN